MQVEPIRSPGARAATTPRVVRAVERGELEEEVLRQIARGVLMIGETQLRYQVRRRRRRLSGEELLDELLAELEQRGLIESEMHYRLTAEGATHVPEADRPALISIGSIPWGTYQRAEPTDTQAPALGMASPPRARKRSRSSRGAVEQAGNASDAVSKQEPR